ncbi:hypothetical protein KUTeg_016675, partial [Tegillarca granosa]
SQTSLIGHARNFETKTNNLFASFHSSIGLHVLKFDQQKNMSSKNRKDSEYSDIYKLKSGTTDARAKRLQRRSLDWKNQRDDELNKRRDLANLSPVQELSQITSDTSYKGKTPVKAESKATALKQKLAKWKQEKEAKKKQAEKEKKPTFRVFHVEHKDTDLFTKDKKNCSTSGLKKPTSLHVPDTVKTRQKPTDAVAAKPTKITVNTKKTITEKAHNTVATTKKTSASRSQNAAKGSNSGEIFKRPVSTRVTRSVSANAQTSVSTRTTRQPATSASGKNKGQDTRKDHSAASKKTKELKKAEVNLNNVSTYRGDSFAPNDFTFTVPANISSFTFTPLSPASSAAFLFPNQDDQNSVSFLGSVPKRSSTPKKGSNTIFKDETKMDLSDKTLISDKTVIDTCTSDGQDSEITKKELSGTEKQNKSATQSDSGISNMDQSIDKQTQNGILSDNSMVDKDSEIPKRLTRSMRRSESVRDRSTSKRRHNDSSDQTMSASDTEERIPKRRRKSTRKSVSTHVQIKVQVELHSAAVTDEEDRGSEMQSDSDNNVNSKCATESDTDTDTKNTRSKDKISVTPVENSSINSNNILNSEVAEQNVSESSPLGKKNTGRRKSKKSQNESFSGTPITKATPKSGGKVMDTVPDEVFSEEKENTKVKTQVSAGNNEVEEQKDSIENSLQNSSPKVKPRRSIRKSLSTNANTPQSSRRKSRKSELKETWVNEEEMSERKVLASETEIDLKSQDSEKQIQEKAEEKPGENICDKNEENVTPLRRATRSTRKVKLLAKSPMVEMSRRTPKPKSPVDNLEEKMEDSSEGEHDVAYFRKLLVSETDKLNDHCDRWQKVNDTSDLTEEARGQIRTCIGQAQLLISQRFKQFSGLVDNCEFKLGEKETTCTDLQGFWDMIYFQVEDVHIKFSDLQKLKDNNWISDKPEPVKKILKKKVTQPKTTKPSGKSKFAEFRNQMKKQKEVVPVHVFDGGFFKIASPEKSPKVHCEGGTPKPKSAEKREGMRKSPEQKPQIETPSSNSSEKKPLQNITVPNTYTSPIITPARKRSYIPVVPSPLLKDSTPQPRPKRRSSVKKLLTEQENTENSLSNTDKSSTGDVLTEIKDSKLMSVLDNDHETSITEKVTKSALRRSTRQSIRTRKSVSFCNLETNDLVSSDSDTIQEVPQQDDLFSMYLQPTNARLSLAPEKSILEQHFGNDSFTDDIESAIGDENYLETSKISSQNRKRRSSLKDLPSKDKRRSTRRSSVSFPSPINENPLVTVSENLESSVFSPTQSRRFSNLNVGFTPVPKKARPSLLYTPPKEQSKSGSCVQDVPTATLISFSP